MILEDSFRVVSHDGKLELLRVVNPAVARGGFLAGETELTQRIDFTQHCISAYLQKLVDIDKQLL